MDATAAPTTGSLCSGWCRRCQRCPFLSPQLPSQAKQSLPTPCIEAEQGGSVFTDTPSDEMPRQQITSAGSAHNFVQFEPRWTRLTGTADQFTLHVSLAFTWALTYQSLPFRCLRSKCPFCCWIKKKSEEKKKKITVAGGVLAPYLILIVTPSGIRSTSSRFRISELPLWLFVSAMVLWLLHWIGPPPPPKKKKRGRGLGEDELSFYACHDHYAASWMASAAPSATSLPCSSCWSKCTEYSECSRQVFCVVGYYFTDIVINWTLCTVDLSLYLTLFPERNRLYILSFLESLSSLFSPLAGEGFTCLDHSKLSKKKKAE